MCVFVKELSPSLARRKVEPDSGVMVPQPTAVSDDNALQTELSKSYKRIADLETRINDLTLQTTLVMKSCVVILVHLCVPGVEITPGL